MPTAEMPERSSAGKDPAAAPRRSAVAVPGGRRRWLVPGAILLVALAARLAVLPASHEGNMSPDAAHFLNVARCVARGQGFSNPAAWPAWLEPARLPAPETFKDPGLPYAIAALASVVRDPFRAGQAISLLAGLLLPLAVYALGLRLARDRIAAAVAGLIAAASPILIVPSVRVMAESPFILLLTLAFVAAAPAAGAAPASGSTRAATVAGPWAAGGLLGLAFLVRTQALLALPALVLLLVADGPARAGAARAARALLAMLAVASPLLVRNLLRFGAPLYSDAATFAVWPFVDPIEFSHAPVRPPAPLPFLLAHAPEVAAHTAQALFRFARSTLPMDVLGHPLWAPALAVGVVLAIARPRVWGWIGLVLVPMVLMMSAVSWNTRYFASTAPFWCLLTGLGAAWLIRRLPARLRGRSGAALAMAGWLVLVVAQTRRAAREAAGAADPEIAAACAEAPFIASRLGPGESLMAVTTSYWSWFSDRPSVHLVIAGEAEFMAVVRRHRVRWAALPTSRLAGLAARYPGGRLPAALHPDHADPERDVTVFAVRDPAQRLTP